MKIRVMKIRLPGRVWSFVALATALAAANTYGSTLAAALFLNRAGATAIPLYYLLYAALSIPLSMAFSQVIDRFPRPVLFTFLLAAGGVVMAAAAPLARGESVALFYALYILVSVFEQLSYSVFYVLMADYFTAVETNRSTTAIAIGMALGGLAGGGLAGLGAEHFSAADLMFGMAALLAGVVGLFALIRRTTPPLGEAEPQAEEGLFASLAALRPLIARYPIVGLLAVGVFLNIVVQSLIEYQVFVVYTDHYPDERALTRFLGVLNGVLNMVNILTSALLTGPLLARIGVARMNLVYPLMTVSAFAAFGASFSLPAAIFGHTVYDPWAHSVDAPVFVANYNAMPHRFVGRVRIFNDGLMYPLAMAATGAGLWFFQDEISQNTVTLIGLAVALAFLACGFALRRSYTRGLMEMLRSGSVDLDKSESAIGAVPPELHGDIRRLLGSGDEHSQGLGLELAARSDPKLFQREIEDLVSRAAAPVRSIFIRQFASQLTPSLTATLIDLLEAEEASVRSTAIEALMTANHPLEGAMLEKLIRDPAPSVSILAAVDAFRRGQETPSVSAALDRLITAKEAPRLRVLQAIRRCNDAALLPILDRMRRTESDRVLTGVLEAVAELGPTARAADWAKEILAKASAPTQGTLRAAAYRLLATQGDLADLPLVAAGLEDVLKEVRLAAAAGLAAFGEAALPAVESALKSGDDLHEDAATEAAGRIGGAAVNQLLYQHLSARHFSAVRRNTRWLQALPPIAGVGKNAASDPANDPWAPLAAALLDANRRALDVALDILGALGYRRTLQAMRGILSNGSARSRANAVETIASIGHRRFVQPLLPMLELGIDPATVRRGTGSPAELAEILDAAAVDANRWIRAGMLFAGLRKPSPGDDTDPIVQNTIAHLRNPKAEDSIMNRLIFLKSVPLFTGLSLDDLLSVDQALGHEDYLDGEAIMRQGDTGTTLYILAGGTASVRLGGTSADAADGKEVARLSAGDFFGEMSLFDDQPRSATVMALTDAAVLTLERDRFSTLVLQRPEVLLHICRMFGNRLRETNRKLLAA
jgi:MFS family permease